MWEIPTSMMSRPVLGVVVGIVVLASVGVGFLVGYEYRGSPASSPGAILNSTLSVLGAGTLNGVFPRIAAELVNETPGISAPAAAQTYEGSLEVSSALAALGARADVAALADFRLIPGALEPRHAAYEVVFAATPEVLAYDPAIPAFDGVNASNWAARLVEDVTTPGDAPFAVWNASTDPNGYNEIFSLELQGLVHDGNPSKYYDTFYSAGATRPAVPTPSTTLIEREAQAASLLQTRVVSALITYRAYAVANHLSFVSFDPVVGLEGNDSAALSDYGQVATTIVASNGTFEAVRAAPVLFAVTIPTNAPNPALGAAFVHLLLSPQGIAILSAGGAFSPIFPGWADHPGAVPPVLAPDVTGFPPWAEGFLS